MNFFRKIVPRIPPKPIQESALKAFRESPLRRKLISMPTGVGKTFTALCEVGETLGRSLWLVHRDELVSQTSDCVKTNFKGLECGIVQGPKANFDQRFTIATVQTLSRGERLRRLLEAGNLSLVVVDEAHHAVASTYQKILEEVGAFQDNGPIVMGLTATAQRSKKKEKLYPIFEDLVFYLSLPRAIEMKLLVPMIPLKVPVPFEMDKIKTDPDGDFNQQDLEHEAERVGLAARLARAIVDNAGKRKVLAFACSVNQAERTATELQRLGMASEWIAGSSKTGKRRSVLRAHSAGEIQAVVNCNVLTEGYDDPSVACVAVGRPTRSQGVWLQMVGRGLRLSANKLNCLVIDTQGATDLGLISADTIMSEPEDEPTEGPGGGGGPGVTEIDMVRNALKRMKNIKSFEIENTHFIEIPGGNIATITYQGQPIVLDKLEGRWGITSNGMRYLHDVDLPEAIYAASRMVAELGGSPPPNHDAWQILRG